MNSAWSVSWFLIYVQVYFCEEDQVCLYKALAFDVPFSSEVSSERAQRVTLPALVKPAEVARKSFTGKV
ncbi:hypothetical protein M758_11G086100 [Ceratodon purpureus]|nr:hypothetical protein M758_11G086100 [Ceratodon purpureus]